MNPFLLTDAYKVSHPDQYPNGTEYVYSNVTARKSRINGVDKVVVAGIRYFIDRYLIEEFVKNFFQVPKDEAIRELRNFFADYGLSVDLRRYERLHDLGYLPLKIKALPEGTLCPIGVPFMTIENTNPEFYWLTNFIETLCQCTIWNPITSATIAHRFKKLLVKYERETTGHDWFADYQGHNFSMRGMSSLESAMTTDFGHLLSFKGSDTLPGTLFASKYYGLIGSAGCSVPATEHAVMCAGGKIDERETFRRLITETYPEGIVSIVSDTWDLWNVLTNIAPSLKNEIMARNGKTVFRPDSGDPVRIICGYTVTPVSFDSEYIKPRCGSMSCDERFFHRPDMAIRCSDGVVVDRNGKELSENEQLGCLRLLEREFGATVNDKGYKELDPHVGLIYGDGINYERAEQILEGLKQLGFASTNVVLGIGSWTYQYNTRDTFSIACKATWAQVNGVGQEIFKDPVTDDGTKKSACGLLAVQEEDGELVVKQRVTRKEEEYENMLSYVFKDGLLMGGVSNKFEAIRQRVNQSI